MIATRGFALIFTLMMIAVLAQRPGAAAGAGALPAVQLKTITARALAGGASLVVETSEPTGYVTSRPNPLTILIDLRNVDGQRVTNSVGTSIDPSNPIAAVAVEAAESLGSPISRVRVTLAQPLAYQVRSERNTIVLDLGQSAARARRRCRVGSARPGQAAAGADSRSDRGARPGRATGAGPGRAGESGSGRAGRSCPEPRPGVSAGPAAHGGEPRGTGAAGGRQPQYRAPTRATRSASISRAPTCGRCCACSRRSAASTSSSIRPCRARST